MFFRPSFLTPQEKPTRALTMPLWQPSMLFLLWKNYQKDNCAQRSPLLEALFRNALCRCKNLRHRHRDVFSWTNIIWHKPELCLTSWMEVHAHSHRGAVHHATSRTRHFISRSSTADSDGMVTREEARIVMTSLGIIPTRELISAAAALTGHMEGISFGALMAVVEDHGRRHPISEQTILELLQARNPDKVDSQCVIGP